MVRVEQILSYMRAGSAPPGRVLARIATRQHGVVSREQILALGVGSTWIHRAGVAGHIHRLHLGVYAVGHRKLTQLGRWMAAVLAAGEDSLLSHRPAGLHWGLIDRAPPMLEVVLAGPRTRYRPGIVIHRTRRMPDDHRAMRDGIPVTSPHRTLVDLAAVLPPRRLRFAVEAADRDGLLAVPDLVATCDEMSGKRGVRLLKGIALEARGPVERTKSPPERLFLREFLRHGLPEPEVNVRVEGYEVDFLWRGANLIVEVDTYTFHRSWAQRQRDIERDADLKVKGYDVLRYPPARMRAEPGVVVAQIVALLDA